MNQMMLEIIQKTPRKKVSLSKKLKELLDDGLVVVNDCILFSYFKKANTHLTIDLFEDKTQMEQTINGFHFEDFCRNPTMNHVYCFVYKFNKMIRSLGIVSPTYIFVSFDNGSVHYSFTTRHENEKLWIDPNDLDSYSQAILIIET